MTLLRRTFVAVPAFTALFSATTVTAYALQPTVVVAPTVVSPMMVSPAGFDRDRRDAGPELFTWSGTVDRDVYIVVRGRDVTTRGPDRNRPFRARVSNAIPRGNGQLVLNVEEGRGNVGVIEQPNARNGWQAVIRIQDARGGANRYRLSAYWDDFDRRDRDRDRDGVWDRGRDRDRDDRDRDRDRDRDDRDRDRDDRWGNGRDRGQLQWSGRVDDLVEIRLQGRRVDYITRSGARVSDVRSDINGAGLPRRNVDVALFTQTGRGELHVVQQPNARNGYTAVISIYDPRGGVGFYDFVARW